MPAFGPRMVRTGCGMVGAAAELHHPQRPRLAGAVSVEEYQRLKRRDRRVVRLEDVTEEEMAMIAKAEVPAEYAYLDAELKDWQP